MPTPNPINLDEDNDFAYDKDVQQSRSEYREEQLILEKSIEILKNELDANESSHQNLKKFHTFKPLQAILWKSFRADVNSTELQISICEYYSEVNMGRRQIYGVEKYLVGKFALNKLYPNTYIHKEGLSHKFADIFLKQEVDFENSKKFSRRFYVLSDNKLLLQDMLRSKDLNILCDFKEMEVEITDNECLFRTSIKSISVEETVKFCDLARSLAAVLQ